MTPEAPVGIGAAVLEAIEEHARAERPRECCGLLIGCDGRVTEAVATRNVAAEPTRQYEISPADYIAQIRRCRALTGSGPAAFEVIGAYHSHPKSAPEPSPTDLAQAFPGFLYIIAGPAYAKDITTKAYRLTDERMTPVPLVVR